MHVLAAYLIGAVFGLGIALSGMANPAKVINFFDVFGTFDPSLAFVMGGALMAAAIGYRLVFRRNAPILAERFLVPPKGTLNAQLFIGAGLFGIGWGIAGFCPGGALPALGTGVTEVFIFVAALVAGIVITRLAVSWRQRSTAAA